MGITSSRKYDKIYDVKHDISKHKRLFDALQLTEQEVGLLYESFDCIDIDSSGSIILVELTEYLSLEESSFIKRAFKAFDTDRSKTIDFKEFASAIWDYCTLNKDSLALYAFALYDADDSGIIDKKELEKMLKDMYGKHYKDSPQAITLFVRLEELNMKFFDENFFMDFARTHPAMLYPAITLQLRLQEKIVNNKFWDDQQKRRELKSRGKYVPLQQLIRHVRREESIDEDLEILSKFDKDALKDAMRVSKGKHQHSSSSGKGPGSNQQDEGSVDDKKRRSSLDIRKPPPSFHPQQPQSISMTGTDIDGSSSSLSSDINGSSSGSTKGRRKSQKGRRNSKDKPHVIMEIPVNTAESKAAALSAAGSTDPSMAAHIVANSSEKNGDVVVGALSSEASGASNSSSGRERRKSVIDFLASPFGGSAPAPEPAKPPRERLFNTKRNSEPAVAAKRRGSTMTEKAVRRDSAVTVLRRVSSKSLSSAATPPSRVKKVKAKPRRVSVGPIG